MMTIEVVAVEDSETYEDRYWKKITIIDSNGAYWEKDGMGISWQHIGMKIPVADEFELIDGRWTKI